MVTEIDDDDVLAALYAERARYVWRLPDGRLTTEAAAKPAGLLPGSFNPLHAGHRELRNAAAQFLNGDVCFEMTIRNADKPPMDRTTVRERCRQFDGERLLLTAVPTFPEKSRLMPGIVFVVGVDTAQRIVQTRFYGGSEPRMQEALEEFARADCRFLVAGRKVGTRFVTLDDLDLPQGFSELFIALPPTEFRRDISSTQLRKAAEECRPDTLRARGS